MRKIAFILCCLLFLSFFGCSAPEVKETPGQTQPTVTPTEPTIAPTEPTEPEPTEPTEPEATEAPTSPVIDTLKLIYSHDGTETPVDYTLLSVLPNPELNDLITWTVDVDESFVQLIENEDYTVTVNINELCEEDIPYTLTASVVNADGIRVYHSWHYILPKARDMAEIVREAYALPLQGKLPYPATLTGKVTAIDKAWSEDYQNITLIMKIEAAGNKSVRCCGLVGEGTKDIQVGDVITVTGTLQRYSYSIVEFDLGCKLYIPLEIEEEEPEEPTEEPALGSPAGEALETVLSCKRHIFHIPGCFAAGNFFLHPIFLYGMIKKNRKRATDMNSRFLKLMLVWALLLSLLLCGCDATVNIPTGSGLTEPTVATETTEAPVTDPSDPDDGTLTEPTEPEETDPDITEYPVPPETEPGTTEPQATEPNPTQPKPTEPAPTEPAPTEPPETEPQPTTPGSFEVYFIDVGQADAALVICDGKTMLIDGGNSDDSNLIYSFLHKKGIKYLDYIIATHAHEDHVGGLSGALNYAKVGTVYCPVTSYNSQAFRNFASNVQKQGKSITVPSVGTEFTLGSATCTIYAVNTVKSDANNTSIVMRIVYGNTSFLFTGDAEKEVEDVLVKSGFNLKSDVLKVGHHGSYTSTSYQFLRSVMPEYAVISCGKGNSYGHPHADPLSRLRDADATIFRTDLQGDIYCTSDGKQVTFTVSRNATANTLKGVDHVPQWP